jgi:hypothetical protein
MNIKVVAGVVAGVILLVVIGGFLLADWTYSEGMRQGTISKISRKGFVCKTWEGELAMANFSRDGTLSQDNRGTDNTFYFSVDDKKAANRLQDAMRTNTVVNLAYEQKLFPLSWWLPGTCQRRTEYEVHDIQVVGSAPALGNPKVPQQ